MHRLLWVGRTPFSYSCNYFKFRRLTPLNQIWWDDYQDDEEDVKYQGQSRSTFYSSIHLVWLSFDEDDGGGRDNDEEDYALVCGSNAGFEATQWLISAIYIR